MSDGPGTGGSGPSGEDDFDLEAFEAAFAAHFGETIAEPGLPEGAPGSAEDAADDEPAAGESNTTVTAVVLTPLAHAPALAKIMGLAGMDWPVVATRTGAIAACAHPVPADDLSALTGELPEEIVNVAKALSHTSKYGVVLLSARITHSGEEGPGGKVNADRYVAGEHTESIPPGLVTNGADDVVEQLVLGEIAPEDLPGVLDPAVEAARGAHPPGSAGNPKRGPKRRRP